MDMPNDFFVDWKLLEGMNHKCSYSSEPASAFHESFSEKSTLDAAYRVLSLGYKAYYFNIYGGEPTIYPYFPQLLKYLSTSGRLLKIRFKTNGLAPENYYRNLLQPASRGQILFHIEVHLGLIEIEKVISLLKISSTANQFTYVNIFVTPNLAQKAQSFIKQLTELGNKFEFVAGVSSPGAPSQPVSPIPATYTDILRSFSVFDKGPVKSPGLNIVGAVGAFINPAGEMLLGLENKVVPWQLSIVENPVFKFAMPVIAGFSSLDQAKECLTQFLITMRERQIDSGALRSPFPDNNPLWTNDKVRQKLRHIPPILPDIKVITAKPDHLEKYHGVIASIHSSISDVKSKEILLRFFKASIVGNKSYLAPDQNIPEFAATEARSRTISSKEELECLLAKTKWKKQPLAFSMSIDEPWPTYLFSVVNEIPDREILLGTDGEKLFVSSKSPTSNEEKRTSPSHTSPDWTFVFISPDMLHKAEEIALEMAKLGIKYEILFIVERKSIPEIKRYSKTIPAERANAIRIIQIGDANPATIWNTAIRAALGEYVTFNPTAPVSDLLKCYNHLRSHKDVKISFLFNEPWLENETSGINFLLKIISYGDAIPGVSNHVYHRKTLADHCEIPLNEMATIPESFLNIMALHSIEKVRGVQASHKLPDSDIGNSRIGFRFLFSTLASFCKAFEMERKMSDILAGYYAEKIDSKNPDDALFEDEAKLMAAYKIFPSLIPHIFSKLVSNYKLPVYEIKPKATINSLQPHLIKMPYNVDFPLSIVVDVRNSRFLNWVEYATKAGIESIEWIVVDNCDDEDTKLMLDDLCSLYPNIRIIRYEKPVSPAEAFNEGGKAASGKMIAFINGDSTPKANLAAIADRHLADERHDLFLFGLSNDKNLAIKNQNNDDNQNNPINALPEAIKSLAIERIFFKTDWFGKHELAFNPASPSPCLDLILRAMNLGTAGNSLDEKLFSVCGKLSHKPCLTPESLKYANIIYDSLEKLKGISRENTEQFSRYFFQNVWLPIFGSFKKNLPNLLSMPLSPLFLKTLFMEYQEHKVL